MDRRESKVALVLLAAGSASRMGEEKLLMRFGGKTPIAHCAAAIAACETRFCETVLTVSAATKEEAARSFPYAKLVRGGKTRGESVKNALFSIEEAQVVVIHDVARCLVTPSIIDESVRAAFLHGSGVAAIPARDTIWYAGETMDRSKALLAQTPQSFLFERIRAAYKDFSDATDDCGLYKAAGYEPFFCAGALQNQKLTFPEDIPFFAAILGEKA